MHEGSNQFKNQTFIQPMRLSKIGRKDKDHKQVKDHGQRTETKHTYIQRSMNDRPTSEIPRRKPETADKEQRPQKSQKSLIGNRDQSQSLETTDNCARRKDKVRNTAKGK